jgi:tripartite motif-containing protein 56
MLPFFYTDESPREICLAAEEPRSRRTQRDVTECPICDDVYSDPRQLPCQHTFCLKCIARLDIHHAKCDSLACPLCGQENPLPHDGLGGLPKNIFICKLIQSKEMMNANGKQVMCDTCSSNLEDDSDMVENNQAEEYCVDCKLKLCKGCKHMHRRSKANRSHRFVKLNANGDISDQHFKSLLEDCCSKHNDEKLRLYCQVCKTAVCMSCYDEEHANHQCSSVRIVDTALRSQLSDNILTLSLELETRSQYIGRLQGSRNSLAEKVFNIQNQVRQEAERLRFLINQDEQILLRRLAPNHQRAERISSELARQKGHISLAEWTRNYINEVRSKGIAVDVARQWRATKQLQKELLKYSPEWLPNDFGSEEVIFTLSKLKIVTSSKNVVGEISHTLTTKGNNYLFRRVF